MTSNTTVDPAEVEKFAALAAVWWDHDGPFKPLHRLNPIRLRFIRDRLAMRFGRDVQAERPLEGLRVVDIGCGGGLLAEPLTRLGASVTGIDATEKNIGIARIHAADMGLAIDYRVATAESLAGAGEQFDAVLNMEVIEHVANVDMFLAATAALTKPEGAMFLATLNRTAKAYALAIVGAEYLLRWLPRGTHDWQRFVKPSELAAGLRAAGMTVTEMTGVVYNPFSDRWSLDPDDLAVNYMAVAERRAAKPEQAD
ncbi:MAG: bifunctional 2-polyprenyl-6-hydroxyphenol methylase/3-demethylubiquinol 3-O-methyltransferase UbiG [Alphaproteobacteria bacterium]